MTHFDRMNADLTYRTLWIEYVAAKSAWDTVHTGALHDVSGWESADAATEAIHRRYISARTAWADYTTQKELSEK